MDTYLTIKAAAEAQLTEKRSRFLAFAHHVDNEEEARSLLARYKKTYHDARHVCYAYVIGAEAETVRANDDGEPSGTAGRPILGQISSRNLCYTMVAVVRYFGGVKLGTGPLGVAYKTVASQVLDAAETRECIVTSEWRMEVPYADADVAMRFVREAKAQITARDYTLTGVVLSVCVRRDDGQALHDRLEKILTLRFL